MNFPHLQSKALSIKTSLDLCNIEYVIRRYAMKNLTQRLTATPSVLHQVPAALSQLNLTTAQTTTRRKPSQQPLLRRTSGNHISHQKKKCTTKMRVHRVSSPTSSVHLSRPDHPLTHRDLRFVDHAMYLRCVFNEVYLHSGLHFI